MQLLSSLSFPLPLRLAPSCRLCSPQHFPTGILGNGCQLHQQLSNCSNPFGWHTSSFQNVYILYELYTLVNSIIPSHDFFRDQNVKIFISMNLGPFISRITMLRLLIMFTGYLETWGTIGKRVVSADSAKHHKFVLPWGTALFLGRCSRWHGNSYHKARG